MGFGKHERSASATDAKLERKQKEKRTKMQEKKLVSSVKFLLTTARNTPPLGPIPATESPGS